MSSSYCPTCRVPFWKGVGDSQELSLKWASPVPPNCAPPPACNVTDEKDIILAPHRTLSSSTSSLFFTHLNNFCQKSNLHLKPNTSVCLLILSRSRTGLGWFLTVVGCHFYSMLYLSLLNAYLGCPLGRVEFEGRVGDRRFLPEPH